MDKADVIIIGAGAAGMLAARELAASGKSVILLEAKSRAGGRIYTLHDPEFPLPAELGAEFIHGKLKKTISLLKHYKIHYHKVKGEIMRVKNRSVREDEDFVDEHEKELKRCLESLEDDMPVDSFLDKYFSGSEYSDLKYSVRKFVEGYDGADPAKASAMGFYNEWYNAQDWEQFRIEEGYSKLIDCFMSDAEHAGCVFRFSEAVKQVVWKKGEVKVFTGSANSYRADTLLVTVPLGVWQSDERSEGGIEFVPPLKDKQVMINNLAFGRVIKICMKFSEAFWKDEFRKMSFLFSEESIPTWWTQYPDEHPVLYGWLGGSSAERFRSMSNTDILEEALRSVTSLFGKENAAKLRAWELHNWLSDPFCQGGYSYSTPGYMQAIKEIIIPEKETIYFAGEAFNTDDETGTGTVEAALLSAERAVREILAQ